MGSGIWGRQFCVLVVPRGTANWVLVNNLARLTQPGPVGPAARLARLGPRAPPGGSSGGSPGGIPPGEPPREGHLQVYVLFKGPETMLDRSGLKNAVKRERSKPNQLAGNRVTAISWYGT